MMNRIAFDQVEFDDTNPEPRCPCVLLLDTSGSMGGERMVQLNKGIQTFAKELKKDSLASLRVEVAVITFGGEVHIVQDFVSAADFNPPTLSAEGNTPMGNAIATAVHHIEVRKKTYRSKGVTYYRPWIFMITDGAPTDGDLWIKAAERVREGEEGKKLIFFAIGVQGADMEILAKISPIRQPLRLHEMEFEQMFVWLSGSVASVSRSTPGDRVPLTPPTGWAEV
jgi:uncharacterized protein YegL